MNKLSSKLVSVALSLTTAISFSGAFLPVAHAQTVADLQTQISALLAQIQQLQAQLGSAQGGSAAACSFTRDLTVGSTGADVTCLQKYLNGAGHQVAASGAGSPGNESSYFGSLTKAAAAKWQAANGVSPAVGYFGSISRAKYNSLAGGTGTGTPTGPYVPPPATGLAASLASNNPAAGSLISGTASAARVPVLAVNLTAGNASGVTVNELKFKKTGVLSDSSIAGAYLIENGQVVAQYNSITNGVVVFSGLGFSVAAGQTKNLTLAVDPATGLSAGNTVGFALNAAGDVSATDASSAAITTSGAFPLNGNTFTVTTVTNPSIATLTVASSSIGTTVTAGTNNNLVGAWNFTVSNSKVYLKSINFKVIGSASKSDIRNVKLLINGTQAGQTLAQVNSSGNAYLDATANPATLNTGSNNVQVYADIMGSPSFNFQFEILNSYEIYAVDSQYNVPISGQSNVGTQLSITAGTLTVSQASDTPTGNIAASQSGVTVAKFTIYAGGEAVKVKWLGVTLTMTGGMTGGTTSNIDTQFKNLSLVDDAGGQVGTTINTLSTSVTCTNSVFANTSSTYTNCFGNTSSPINYIVPANTTRVLSLKVDAQSTIDITTVVGKLTGNTSNLQGLTSSQTASSAAVNGAALTITTSNLTTAANSAFGAQNISAGATNRKIGSYALTASSAEGVTVNNLSVTANGAVWTNLRLMVGSAQFGTTQGTVSSGTTYSFSGTPFTVPIGGTTYVDVYADTLSTASAAVTPGTVLSGCSASGATSLTAISCTARNGQNITFAGQATLTVTADSATAPAKQIVMSTNGQSLATFRFTETSNVEDVKITDLNIFDQVAATNTTKSAFSNIALYNGTTLVGTAGTANTAASTSNPGPGYYYTFHFATPVVIPQSNSISLTLKGDVASYSSSGATDNTTHVFKIATSTDSVNNTTPETVVALGSTSNATSAVTLSSATGNAQTILRSKLTVTATAAGVATGRAKGSVDDLGYLNFTADAAGAVKINSVTLTFSGSAPSGTNFFNAAAGKIKLYDSSTGTSYNKSASSLTTLSFDMLGYTLSGGTTKSFILRLDSLTPQTVTAASGVSVTLSATIDAATDVVWSDALDTAAVSTLSLESTSVPLQINSVSYAQGT
jgi:hypothetical protein